MKCDHKKNKTDSVVIQEPFENLLRDQCDALARPQRASLGK